MTNLDFHINKLTSCYFWRDSTVEFKFAWKGSKLTLYLHAADILLSAKTNKTEKNLRMQHWFEIRHLLLDVEI